MQHLERYVEQDTPFKITYLVYIVDDVAQFT